MKKDMILKFNFSEDKVIAGKYLVMDKLGKGWEGEVYKGKEISTGILCAIKFFFPHRNLKNKVANTYAKKLSNLSQSPVAINYYTQESIQYKGQDITCFIFEYAEGEILSTFLNRQVGKRVGVLQGLQLLHSLAGGVETLHRLGEYHGDLHSDNIVIKRRGLGFDFKLLDMYNWGDSKSLNKAEDICNLIRLFYDAIGGKKQYQKHPPEVKEICLGLKKSLIRKKFKTVSHLREYIENIEWHSVYRV